MTIDEKFDLLISEIRDMKQDIKELKGDVATLKSDVAGLKSDVAALKGTALIVENDIAPKVQALLENHSDLAKNMMIAKEVDERVGALEFDIKVIKGILNKSYGTFD